MLCLARDLSGVVATEMDHTRPVALGGARWDRNNVRGLCSPCHAKKSATEKANIDKAGLVDLYPWHDFDQ